MKAVETLPFNFDNPDALARSLEGADTLFNTYWVRVAHRGLTHDRAAANLRTLFDAAKAAGVRRVIHVSITNADASSPLSYFRCKGLVENALRESGLSHAILRPTLVFGIRGHTPQQHRVDAAPVPGLLHSWAPGNTAYSLSALRTWHDWPWT